MKFIRFGLVLLAMFRLLALWARFTERRSNPAAIMLDGERVLYRVGRDPKSKVPASVSVAVEVPLSLHFALHPERTWDRLAKYLGLVREWQADDPAFDPHVYVFSEDPAVLDSLGGDSELRQRIARLVRNETARLTCDRGQLWLTCPLLNQTAGIDDQVLAGERAPRLVALLKDIRARLLLVSNEAARRSREPRYVFKDILLSTCAVLGILGVGVFLWEMQLGTPRQIVDDLLEIRGAITGGIVGMVLVVLLFVVIRRSSYTHMVLVEVLLVGFPGAWSLAHAAQTWANQAWDRSVVTVLELPVEYRYVSRGRRGSSYTLGVSGWPDVRAGRSLTVRRSLYDAVPEGSCLEVRWRSGYYGDPWVESWTPRPACSKGRAERAPAVTPDGEYATLMREVYRHFQDREWAEALVVARRVTLLRPDDARTLQVAGYAAQRAGDHAAAVTFLTKAVTLDPRAGAIWRDLGQAQLRLGQFEPAEQSLTRALLLFPIDAQALTDRAALRVRREDPAAALVDARRACELGDRQGCAIAKEIESR